MPCFAAWYAARPSTLTKPPSDAQFTLAPLPCFCFWASWYFMQANTPRRLMPSMADRCERRVDRRGQFLPGGGQCDRSVCTVEHAYTEALFKCPERMAERGRAHPHLQPGETEIAVPGDCEDIGEFGQIRLVGQRRLAKLLIVAAAQRCGPMNCAFVTGSSQVTLLPASVSLIARWLIPVVVVAPCQ